MRLQFGTSSFERARGGLPTLPVVNMFAESAPTEEIGLALQSRPGLEDRAEDMGAGPVAALFKGDGVLDSALYGVSAGHLWQETTDLGGVNGAGPFSIAGYEDLLFTAGGGDIWGWDGGTLAVVAFPDAASVSKVVVGAARLIAIRVDTEKFYWSSPLTSTIDAIALATAESQPDRLRDMVFLDDILVLGGAETIEFWPNTSDPDLPFQPLEGRVFERGVKATGCMTLFGTTFAWVSDKNQVCISDPENIVSHPGMEALIEASTATKLWSFHQGGTEFLALTIDGRTWGFSNRSKMWSEFASYGEDNFVPHCFAGGVFGSSVDGRSMAWGSGWEDLGGVLDRRFRAGAPLNAGGITVDNLLLRTNPGETGYLTGTYADPSVEVRLSRDGGRTWGAWKARSLGSQGAYRKLVQWAALGMFGHPGIMCEFRVTDPVDFRVSDVRVNEPFGGI